MYARIVMTAMPQISKLVLQIVKTAEEENLTVRETREALKVVKYMLEKAADEQEVTALKLQVPDKK